MTQKLNYTVDQVDDDIGRIWTKDRAGGIKVDQADPTYPWRDIIGNVAVTSLNPTNPPTLTEYITGSDIYQYQFGIGDQATIDYHIPHDYLQGSNLFIHFHWSVNQVGVTGDVTWGTKIIYSKGHDQMAFNAVPISLTCAQNVNGTQYFHQICEVEFSAVGGGANLIDTDDLEVDGLVIADVYLSNHTLSGGAEPFLHTVDIHYQSTGIGTKQKAPDFWT